MELHNDDIPGSQTDVQRFAFTKSLVLGTAGFIFGIPLAVVGFVTHQNPTVPILAALGGAAIVTFDLMTRRARNKRQG